MKKESLFTKYRCALCKKYFTVGVELPFGVLCEKCYSKYTEPKNINKSRKLA